MHSDNEQPSSSDPPDRKSSKPLMEKRRRARINSSLAELKTLLMDVIRREGACHSKMEKADILEMTVRHLRQITGSSTTDPTTGSKHKLGFVECTQEVSRFLSQVEGCDVELRTRLLDHLANVASGSERNERVSSLPLLSVHTSNQNQPVITNFPMQEPSRQLPVVSESMPYKIDLNPSIQTSSLQSNLMSGLQVIPTQLRSGEIAFVLPTQIAEIQKSSGVVIPLLNPVNPKLTLSSDGIGSCQTRDVSKPYRRIRVKSETVSSPPKSPPPPPSDTLPSTPITKGTGESHKPLASASTQPSCASNPFDLYTRIPNRKPNPQTPTSSDIKDNEPLQIQRNILAEGHEKQYTIPKDHDDGQVVKKDDINIIPTFSDISQTDPNEKLSAVCYPGSHNEHTSTKAVGLLDTQTYTNIVKSSSYAGPNALFSTRILIPPQDKGLDLRLSEQVSETFPNIKYDSKESPLFSFARQHDAIGGDSAKTLKDTIWTLPSSGSSLTADIKSNTQHDNCKLDENDNNFHHERQSDRDENDNNINENANENQEPGMWRPW